MIVYVPSLVSLVVFIQLKVKYTRSLYDFYTFSEQVTQQEGLITTDVPTTID